MAKLFDGDSESDTEMKLNLETKYAKNYDGWRQKEVLETLKARYGDQDDDGGSSSEEDELGIELTPQVEKNFFHTLACLKRDDSTLYDANHRFFDKRDEAALERAKTEKPMFLREFERRRILEHGGIDVDEDDPGAVQRSLSPSMAQEQRDLVASFRTAVDSDSDTEGLLAPRKRKPADMAAEEASYASWLQGKAGQLDDEKVEADLKPLRDYWTDPQLAEGEAFLKNYVLGKPYMASGGLIGDELKLSDDEGVVEKMEDFERRFNFRFEEPDSTLIKSFPRTMENSVRLKDNRRKERRQATKSHKEQRREVQVQELMQLKALKRKEIQDRIEALKKVTGNDTLAFQDSDVEGEFDPNKHDARMQSLFNDPFYADNADDKKPEFSDLDDDADMERWDDYGQSGASVGQAGQSGSSVGRASQSGSSAGQANQSDDRDEAGDGEEEEVHCEDSEFNMDADYDPTTAPAKSKRQRKRKMPVLWAALAKPHPTFDPAHGTFDAFVDEYYKMDFEDIIGDLPCRFKYRQVPPNDFGLSIDEILAADDKELNQWASLKKAVRLRSEAAERNDQISYKQRGKNEQFKRKVLSSLYQEREKWEGPEGDRPVWEGPGAEQKKKKKKAGGKKKRRGDGEGREHEAEQQDGDVKKKKKNNKTDEASEVETNLTGINDRREIDNALENGEIKKKKKKKNKTEEASEVETNLTAMGDRSEIHYVLENGEIKKKIKKKQQQNETGLNTKKETKQARVQKNKIVHQNGEEKKKKKHRKEEKQTETMLVVESQGTETKRRNKEKKVKKVEPAEKGEMTEGSVKQGKAKKRKQDGEEDEAGTSRRKRKNLKLQEKREPIAAVAQPKKKSKPRNRERDLGHRNHDNVTAAEGPFTENRLAAYGMPRPKRFLNYLKYKEQDPA